MQNNKRKALRGRTCCLLAMLAIGFWPTVRANAQEGGLIELAGRGLSDPDARVRLAALELLQHQWRLVRSELQTELRAARKEQAEHLLQLQRAILQQSDRLAHLVQSDPEPLVRQRAIHTLALLQPDWRNPRMVSAWQALLQSPQRDLSLSAVQAWRTLLEARIADLTNPRLETTQSLQAGRQLASDLATLSETFRLALDHAEVSVRAETLAVLDEALTPLVQRLSSLQNQLSLAGYRPLTVGTIQDVIVMVSQLRSSIQNCLALPHVSVRRPACHILEALGSLVTFLREEPLQPEGGKLADQLHRELALLVPDVLDVALYDKHQQVRLDAWEALETFEPLSSRTWPALVQALRDDHPAVRWTAARCLDAGKSQGLTEAERAAIVRSLVARLLQEEEVSIRLRLTRSLQTWRVDLLAARHELAQALRLASSDWPSSDFGPFLPAHRQASRQVRDQDVLLALLTALRQFAEHHRQTSSEPLPAEWLTGIVAALAAEKPIVRIEACRLLGLYGTQAYAVRSAVVPLLQDSDPNVRGAAAIALLRITPAPQ